PEGSQNGGSFCGGGAHPFPPFIRPSLARPGRSCMGIGGNIAAATEAGSPRLWPLSCLSVEPLRRDPIMHGGARVGTMNGLHGFLDRRHKGATSWGGSDLAASSGA